MFHSNSVVSAGLAVALSAGVAGIFTVATTTAPPEMDRSADRRAADHDLSSIMFDARPIAVTRQSLREPKSAADPLPTMTEQVLPERMNEIRNVPPATGCESGLSPDLAQPVSVKAGRCLTLRDDAKPAAFG